jgi:hypothetical protein
LYSDRSGIFLTKLFLTTVRKNCSLDQEKLELKAAKVRETTLFNLRFVPVILTPHFFGHRGRKKYSILITTWTRGGKGVKKCLFWSSHKVKKLSTQGGDGSKNGKLLLNSPLCCWVLIHTWLNVF